MRDSLVRDVMTTDAVTVEPSTPFKEIVARLARYGVSAVPVLDADRRVLGVVTESGSRTGSPSTWTTATPASGTP